MNIRSVNLLNSFNKTILYILFSAVMVGGVIGGLEMFLVEPELSQDAKAVFIPDIQAAIMPEFKERTIFMLATLFCPLVIFLVILGVDRLCRSFRLQNLNIFMPVTVIAVTVIFMGCFGNKFMGYFFARSSYASWGMLAIAGMAAAICWFLVKLPNTPRKFWCWRWFVLLSLPIVQVLSFRFCYLNSSRGMLIEHMDIIAYAISQGGKLPLNLHQYGLYPEFLAPVFSITGTSLPAISLVMGGLFFLCFPAIYFAVDRFIKNRVLLVFLAVVFTLVLGGTWKYVNFYKYLDPYFAYFPVRFLFPSLILPLYFYYLRNPAVVWRIGMGVFCAVAFLWNFDSGIPIIGGLFFGHLMELIFLRERRKNFFLTLVWLMSMFSSLALIYAFLSWRWGDFILLKELFKFQLIFSASGAYMLPIPGGLHPWMMVIFIYLTALTLGISAYVKGHPSTYSRFITFLAVMGVGLFSYYQGRSHDHVLIGVMWVALILFFMMSDKIVTLLKAGKLPRIYGVTVVPMIILVSLCGTTLLMGAGDIYDGVLTTVSECYYSDSRSFMTDELAEIKKITAGRTKVNIIAPYQGIVYAETGLSPGTRSFCLIEVFFKSDRERIFAELASSPDPLILYHLKKDETILGRIPQGVLAHYRLREVTSRFLFFEPNTLSAATPETPAPMH